MNDKLKAHPVPQLSKTPENDTKPDLSIADGAQEDAGGEVKPCPFCGGKPFISGNSQETWAECDNNDCVMHGWPIFVEKWNTRTPQAPEKIEGLSEAIEWFDKILDDAMNNYGVKAQNHYKALMKAARRYAEMTGDV